MKRIKDIIAALKTLSNIPSTTISAAWACIKIEAENATTEDGAVVIRSADIRLIDSIIAAVVGIAKDDEDKATKQGKADKPA